MKELADLPSCCNPGAWSIAPEQVLCLACIAYFSLHMIEVLLQLTRVLRPGEARACYSNLRKDCDSEAGGTDEEQRDVSEIGLVEIQEGSVVDAHRAPSPLRMPVVSPPPLSTQRGEEATMSTPLPRFLDEVLRSQSYRPDSGPVANEHQYPRGCLQSPLEDIQRKLIAASPLAASMRAAAAKASRSPQFVSLGDERPGRDLHQSFDDSGPGPGSAAATPGGLGFIAGCDNATGPVMHNSRGAIPLPLEGPLDDIQRRLPMIPTPLGNNRAPGSPTRASNYPAAQHSSVRERLLGAAAEDHGFGTGLEDGMDVSKGQRKHAARARRLSDWRDAQRLDGQPAASARVDADVLPSVAPSDAEVWALQRREAIERAKAAPTPAFKSCQATSLLVRPSPPKDEPTFGGARSASTPVRAASFGGFPTSPYRNAGVGHGAQDHRPAQPLEAEAIFGPKVSPLRSSFDSRWVQRSDGGWRGVAECSGRAPRPSPDSIIDIEGCLLHGDEDSDPKNHHGLGDSLTHALALGEPPSLTLPECGADQTILKLGPARKDTGNGFAANNEPGMDCTVALYRRGACLLQCFLAAAACASHVAARGGASLVCRSSHAAALGAHGPFLLPAVNAMGALGSHALWVQRALLVQPTRPTPAAPLPSGPCTALLMALAAAFFAAWLGLSAAVWITGALAFGPVLGLVACIPPLATVAATRLATKWIKAAAPPEAVDAGNDDSDGATLLVALGVALIPVVSLRVAPQLLAVLGGGGGGVGAVWVAGASATLEATCSVWAQAFSPWGGHFAVPLPTNEPVGFAILLLSCGVAAHDAIGRLSAAAPAPRRHHPKEGAVGPLEARALRAAVAVLRQALCFGPAQTAARATSSLVVRDSSAVAPTVTGESLLAHMSFQHGLGTPLCLALSCEESRGCIALDVSGSGLVLNLGPATAFSGLTRHLVSFDASRCPYVLGDIAVFAAARGLEHLGLCDTDVGGDLAELLGGTPRLLYLCLGDTRVGGDIHALQCCPRLRTVALARTRCHGDITACCRSFGLSTLDLEGCAVRGSLASLGALPHLSTLSLSGTGVSGALEELRVGGLAILLLGFTATFGDLRCLASAGTLQTLNLHGSDVTGSSPLCALSAVRRMLPRPSYELRFICRNLVLCLCLLALSAGELPSGRRRGSVLRRRGSLPPPHSVPRGRLNSPQPWACYYY